MDLSSTNFSSSDCVPAGKSSAQGESILRAMRFPGVLAMLCGVSRALQAVKGSAARHVPRPTIGLPCLPQGILSLRSKTIVHVPIQNKNKKYKRVGAVKMFKLATLGRVAPKVAPYLLDDFRIIWHDFNALSTM